MSVAAAVCHGPGGLLLELALLMCTFISRRRSMSFFAFSSERTPGTERQCRQGAERQRLSEIWKNNQVLWRIRTCRRGGRDVRLGFVAVSCERKQGKREQPAASEVIACTTVLAPSSPATPEEVAAPLSTSLCLMTSCVTPSTESDAPRKLALSAVSAPVCVTRSSTVSFPPNEVTCRSAAAITRCRAAAVMPSGAAGAAGTAWPLPLAPDPLTPPLAGGLTGTGGGGAAAPSGLAKTYLSISI